MGALKPYIRVDLYLFASAWTALTSLIHQQETWCIPPTPGNVMKSMWAAHPSSLFITRLLSSTLKADDDLSCVMSCCRACIPHAGNEHFLRDGQEVILVDGFLGQERGRNWVVPRKEPVNRFESWVMTSKMSSCLFDLQQAGSGVVVMGFVRGCYWLRCGLWSTSWGYPCLWCAGRTDLLLFSYKVHHSLFRNCMS